MNASENVQRDERTVAVENASYRWAYIALTYALLLDVIYRGGVRHEAAWDLLAMVVVGGAIGTIHQARQKILAHGWAWKALLVACVAGVTAAVIAMVLVHWMR